MGPDRDGGVMLYQVPASEPNTWTVVIDLATGGKATFK